MTCRVALSQGQAVDDVVYVFAAGWEKANGVYLHVAEHQDASVYENRYGFLLSRECPLAQQEGGAQAVWILGVGGRPLYLAQTLGGGLPSSGWRTVVTWGLDPPPQLQQAGNITEAVLAALRDRMPAFEAALANEDWGTATKILQEPSAPLFYSIDSGEPNVSKLQAEVRTRVEEVSVRRAQALQRDAEAACDSGKWAVAAGLHRASLSELAECNGVVAQCMREKVQAAQVDMPRIRFSSTWSAALSAFANSDWELFDLSLETLRDCSPAARSAGFFVDEVEEESKRLKNQSLVRRAGAAKELGQTSLRNNLFDQADVHFAEALSTLEKVRDEGAGVLLKEIQCCRAEAAARHADKLVEEAETARQKHDWDTVDRHVGAARHALGQCERARVQAASNRLETFAQSTAERKLLVLKRMGDEAAQQGDWLEADQCWYEALHILEGNPVVAERAGDVRGELLRARCWVGCSQSAELMRQGDASRLEGDAFAAEERYAEAIDKLAPHGAAVDALRSSLHLKRAELRQQKWQYKGALQECEATLARSTQPHERLRAYILAAEASKAIYEQPSLEQQVAFHVRTDMEQAVKFLASAAKLSPEDPDLQRQLRAWRRLLPERPKPVPMPPFDWHQVPKSDKANYFGCVSRQDACGDQEMCRRDVTRDAT